MFKIGKIITAVLIVTAATFFTIRLTYAFNSDKKQQIIVSPLPQTASLTSDNLQTINSPHEENNPDLFKNGINILFLGLDGRKGDKNPRCDALQLVSFNFPKNKITITSIPRGTEFTSKTPDGVNRTDYLSNWCHFLGADFAPKAISKITGIKVDYTVKLGFSQTLGILRNLNLPSTPTLQFLRNRTYGIGDWQRSHNQGQFIKDMMTSHFAEVSQLPNIVKYLIYKTVDTDLPFETATQLFDKLATSSILKNADNIELVTKPNPTVSPKELHFQEDQYQNNSWQKDGDFQTYQNNLEDYLNSLIDRTQKLIGENNSAAYQLIKTPFAQELWLQIEDEEKRDQLHFELLQLYIQSSPDKKSLSSTVLDFITEMETSKKEDYKKRGEELLNYVLRLSG
ncbi:LCP family protein [Candidatus Gottesmanbacteria bacterium]|nr:LCP family protein [Candidatus Gottesmanbacteria bacterium]